MRRLFGCLSDVKALDGSDRKSCAVSGRTTHGGVPLLSLKHGLVRQKSVLVLSGEGPYFKNSSYYDGTMFDLHGTRALAPELNGHPLSGLRLTDLTYSDGSQLRPLLRPNRGAEPHMTSYTLEAEPHLTSYTLESVLMAVERPFEMFDLRQVWDLIGEPADPARRRLPVHHVHM
jgi:hypothetical protein